MFSASLFRPVPVFVSVLFPLSPCIPHSASGSTAGWGGPVADIGVRSIACPATCRRVRLGRQGARRPLPQVNAGHGAVLPLRGVCADQ
jgi:hypothetical protein